MSKKVILFRHAKSNWERPFISDRQRGLSNRGVKDAKHMGLWFAQHHAMPDLIITSSAKRAVKTLKLASRVGNWKVRQKTESRLYLTTPVDMLCYLRELPDKVESVMLVGHEPTWSELANWLIGGGSLRVPTAAMVCMNLQIDKWTRAHSSCALLEWLMKPKLLR